MFGREQMTSLPRLVAFMSVAAVLLDGQSLRVPPSIVDSKMQGQFSILLDSPPEKAPVALQWELSVPPAITIERTDMPIGKAAESSGKSLTCAVKPGKASSPGGSRYACILVGGRDALGQGPIAIVHYRGQADVGGAPVRVGIENIVGVSADLKRIGIPKVDAIIKLKSQE
jgi:hypothetical protein